jgi:xylulokinase
MNRVAPCVLACDLGGSSFRAALVDADGRILHLHTTPLPTPAEQNGISEADPGVWWQVFIETVSRLAAAPAFAGVAAIAISAFTRTQILLDHTGQPLRPAILWRDTRAADDLPALLARLPDHPETAEINAFHPLARLFWLSRAEPHSLARAACVVEPKDVLNLALTGRVVIDRISGARLIAAQPLFAAAGLNPGLVPPAVAPTDSIGPVRPGLPGALAGLVGLPVLAMATDTWASVLGLGALRPGLAYNLSGTTEVLGLIHSAPAHAPGLITIAWGEGLFQIGGPSQTGADSLAWLSRLIGHDVADLAELLARPRDAQPVLFLPYLQGERVPYWDPSLRGAFLGLNRRHGPADLAHAVLEGVACLNRIVLEAAERAAGVTAREIRFGGGGAASAAWCQTKADLLNRPVVVADSAEPGLTGAAIVAFTRLSRFADLAAAQAAMARERARFHPRPAQVAAGDALFTRFRAAEAALAPISRSLAECATVPA